MKWHLFNAKSHSFNQNMRNCSFSKGQPIVMVDVQLRTWQCTIWEVYAFGRCRNTKPRGQDHPKPPTLWDGHTVPHVVHTDSFIQHGGVVLILDFVANLGRSLKQCQPCSPEFLSPVWPRFESVRPIPFTNRAPAGIHKYPCLIFLLLEPDLYCLNNLKPTYQLHVLHEFQLLQHMPNQ